MVDVNALLQGKASDGSLVPLSVEPDGIRTKDAAGLAELVRVRTAVEGTVSVDTGLAPTFAAGLDVRVTSAPAVTGSVSVTNFPASQTVSGTVNVGNLPATQSVSGTVAVSNTSDASAVAVRVINPAATAATVDVIDRSARALGVVSGAVDVTDRAGRALGTVSTGLAQPLTDAQLRATPVTVSNGQTQPLTDTQLRATPVPVSGTVTATPTGTQTVAGTIDVTDRTARLLGVVSVSGTNDVADRVAREVGRIEIRERFATEALQGRAFNATAERTAVASGAVNDAATIAVLSNPALSGVWMHIDKRSLSNTVTARWRRRRNASLTLPAGGRSPVIARGGGGETAAGELIVGGTVGLVVTGGSDDRVNFLGAYAEESDEPNGSIILRPGQNLVWQMTPTAAASGAVFVAWFEKPPNAS